ncbi:hypothetical protein B0T16DRAFT_421684 [Cercophora newfieldiana]|uniref:Fork-head domain-containing protein n=1 Tax=Cercophora newfieldiana TaxID=92897 RepID=A0AA39XR83_9PEZI|nr:hypothetical protein B0T16DRAFT_421684 [Cercophora newfieldiana]
MNSSLQDGVGAPSPAPPAYSPLTDPADPGNREPPSRELSLGATTTEYNANNSSNGSNGNRHREPSPTQQLPPSVNAATDAANDPLPLHQPLPTEMDIDGNDVELPQFSRGIETVPMAAFSNAIDARNYSNTHELYQQHPTSLIMALAQMSANKHQPVSMPPSTVRPANISLPHSTMDIYSHGLPAQSNGLRYPAADAPLESFARIEFADSVFQMTTYAVIIGRDQGALKQARKDEREAEEYQRRCDERLQRGLPPPSPPVHDRSKFSKSYVSEEGGMLGPESDGDDDPRPTKRRKMSGAGGSASGESQPQQDTTTAQEAGEDDANLIMNRQYVSHTPGAAAVNLKALRPSPHEVPFIGIHSPGPQISTRTKAISRHHLRIQFDPRRGVFEAIPLHKNGFFCDDIHHNEGSVVLKSGDRLQIKDVDFIFIINGVPRGKTGAEEYLDDEELAAARRYSEGGKEMSFEFESNHDQEKPSTSDEETQAQTQTQAAKEETPSEASEHPEEEAPQEMEDSGMIETIERDMEEERQAMIKPEAAELMLPPELLAIPQKKRGPGRPPKNGVMSKREERLRKKMIMEFQKQNRPQEPPGEPPIKRKVGRPRKHPAPEDAPDRPEKRKYKPRKKNGEEGDSDPERAIKEKRREKPKTPPLELRREDYSDEQLQKPNKNYGVLIDEVLTAAPDGLTLKQIYKRIQMKYPFYYFTVDTKGWESSVRHNLIGNDAFKKNDETHLWSRVPGIDIDAGKKRKATSPDHAAALQNYGQQYQPQNPAHAGAYRSEHASPANYHAGNTLQRTGYPTSQSPGVMNPHQQHIPSPHAVAGQQPQRPAFPTPGQAPVPPQTAGYQEHNASRQPQGAAPGTSYSSPYVSQPPGTTQPGATPHSMARQYAQPSNGASQVNGLPRVDRLATSTPARGSPAGAKLPQQPTPMANALALKPAVSEELLKLVINFKNAVRQQLKDRYAAPEDVAISAAHRGLGLTTQCMVPEVEALEKIVHSVYESNRKKLGDGPELSLHPSLLQALVNFKTSMIKTLENSLGALKSERLILSAIDRVLGFAEKTTMKGTDAEMSEYVKAENVLIPVIQKMVREHQVNLATAAAAAAAASAPKPAVYNTAPPATAPAARPAPAVNQYNTQAGGQHATQQYATQAVNKPVTQVAPQPAPQAVYQTQSPLPHAAAVPQPAAPVATAATPAPLPAPGTSPQPAPTAPATNPAGATTSTPVTAPLTSGQAPATNTNPQAASPAPVAAPPPATAT